MFKKDLQISDTAFLYRTCSLWSFNRIEMTNLTGLFFILLLSPEALVIHQSRLRLIELIKKFKIPSSRQVLKLIRTFLTWREIYDQIQDRNCLIINFGVKHLQYPTLRFISKFRNLFHYSFFIQTNWKENP